MDSRLKSGEEHVPDTLAQAGIDLGAVSKVVGEERVDAEGGARTGHHGAASLVSDLRNRLGFDCHSRHNGALPCAENTGTCPARRSPRPRSRSRASIGPGLDLRELRSKLTLPTSPTSLRELSSASEGRRCAVLLFDAELCWCTSWAIGLAPSVIISRFTVADDRQILHEGSLGPQT